MTPRDQKNKAIRVVVDEVASHATKSRPRPWRVKRIVDLCVLLFFIGAAVLAAGGAAGLGWMFGRGVVEVLSLNELARAGMNL
jgi:hypothetical protein